MGGSGPWTLFEYFLVPLDICSSCDVPHPLPLGSGDGSSYVGGFSPGAAAGSGDVYVPEDTVSSVVFQLTD